MYIYNYYILHVYIQLLYVGLNNKYSVRCVLFVTVQILG